jgi:hypothetical protein
MKYFLKIFLLSLTLLMEVKSQIRYDPANPHEYYIKRQVCQNVSSTVYEKYYRLIHLSCDWNKFVDAEEQKGYDKYTLSKQLSTTNKLKLSPQSESNLKTIYDIDFKPAAVSSNDMKYKQIHAGLFTDLALQSLSLSNLKLRTIKANSFDSECCRKHLARLDLSNNYLDRFDSNLIENLKRLEHLNLANNQLVFDAENFKHNTNLKSLDLSGNNIQYLPRDLFAGLHELNRVNLSNNQIKNVDACLFESIQTNPIDLKHNPAIIDLTRTPIECDCSIFALSRFE